MSNQPEIINIGTLPNDGSGDPLRVAFEKINNNFSNLYSTGWFTTDTYTIGNTAGQVIFETPANLYFVLTQVALLNSVLMLDFD